ncbi:hypothetical protein R1sor_004905 [Riccia sorocarpa]|uniref:Uncharacterized protein n=1 Tax=Riccia sorocarpa TaxID=122646 RepID=A0ABD3HLX1_9MARC
MKSKHQFDLEVRGYPPSRQLPHTFEALPPSFDVLHAKALHTWKEKFLQSNRNVEDNLKISNSERGVTISQSIPYGRSLISLFVRNMEAEASQILRFAQAFAEEARAEAAKVLAAARAEAEQILCSARTVPSGSSATDNEREKQRREKDAARKHREYWDSRSNLDDSSSAQLPAASKRDRGGRQIHRIMVELVNLFLRSTRSFSLGT